MEKNKKEMGEKSVLILIIMVLIISISGSAWGNSLEEKIVKYNMETDAFIKQVHNATEQMDIAMQKIQKSGDDTINKIDKIDNIINKIDWIAYNTNQLRVETDKSLRDKNISKAGIDWAINKIKFDSKRICLLTSKIPIIANNKKQ
jgi:hypothetical protein